MAWKLNDWYTQQVNAHLDKGIAIDEIDIKLCLSLFLLTPLHGEWLVDFYNHITSGAAKKIIDSGWASSEIEDATNIGLDSLTSIRPFSDIAPIMVELNESSTPFHNHAICDLKSIGYSREDVLDEEKVWGPADDRNIFDVIDEFNDEDL